MFVLGDAFPAAERYTTEAMVLAQTDGRIISGHCDCMAGLGETCTHISALLFYVETAVRIRDARTVTQEAAYWKPPSSAQDRGVAFLPVS